jgi:class 3 adenylate cyclase
LGLWVIFAFSLTFLTPCALAQVKVEKAELDLRGFDLAEMELIRLTGDWLFVPDFHNKDKPEQSATHAFADPSLFWQKASEDIFAKAESGTFFLTIKRLPGQPQISFYMSEMPRYRFYVNGHLIASQGHWQADGQGGPQRGHQQIIMPDLETIDLAFQVATDGPRWQPWPHEIKLGTIARVQDWILGRTILFTLILGGTAVIGIYHFLLFLLNQKNQAPLFLGLFCLMQVARSVLGSEVDTVFHFWPEFDFEWSYKIGYTAFFSISPIYVHYLYLTFQGTLPLKFVKGWWVYSLLFIGLTLVTSVPFYCTWSQIYHLSMILPFIMALGSLVRSLKMGLQGSYILLTGTLILILAAINDIFYLRGSINTGELFYLAVFILIMLQALILSAQFAATFKELRHTYGELTKIAYLHMVQRIAVGLRVEQTMPTGRQHGAVICFDIVGSSRIRHPQLPEAIERVMARCYVEMSQGYDPINLKCRAYRIKEMGDGLLCSVGFPFKLEKDANESSESLQLALDFARIFREEMEALQLAEPAFCSIGIVSGELEGFFPKFGIKQYDLRGRVVVLATRYESMRNQVFRLHGMQGSVIFIQDEVYQNLSAEEKKTFQYWDCEHELGRIRDDVKATRAWFRFVEHARPAAERSVA